MSEANPDDQDEAKPNAPAFRPPIRREAPDDLSRGLTAVEKSRHERNRIKRPPLKVIVWFSLLMAVALALYFYVESNQVESRRQLLLAKEREAIATYGDKWLSVRNDIEAWTVELAGKPEVDLVETEELAKFDFQQMPGIYLRLRKDQAKDPASVREGAMGSLRDAFTSCLMHSKADPMMAGKECQESVECELGELCNEYGHCSKPGQPYNLRLAYRAFFVLSPEWEKEVREADSTLALRALDLHFEDSKRIDFPMAIDLLAQAQFFLVVIDERPPPESSPDAGVSAEDADAIAGVTYASRIGLFRLSDRKPLLRITRNPKPQLIVPGGIRDPSVLAAHQRQAYGCALASEVRAAISR